MDSFSNRKPRSIQKFLFATALACTVGFDSACASGSEAAARAGATPAGKGATGGEIGSGSEVTAARLAEEQWERVDVAALNPSLPSPPRPNDAAAPSPVLVEEVPFDAGAAVLSPEVREYLDGLAVRLSAGVAGSAGPASSIDGAHCRLALRPAHPAIAESDPRLIEERVAAIRQYLSGEKGISETSITVGAAGDPSFGDAIAGDCVVVALLD